VFAAAVFSVAIAARADEPPAAPSGIVGKDGLMLKSVSASYPVMPLPALVLPNDWLELARRAGLPADDEQFKEALEACCHRRRQEATASRQRHFQADFDRAAGLLPTEGASLDEVRRSLKARILKQMHDELRTDFESFKQGVTAAAGKAGALDALDDAAISAVGMHHLRSQIRILLAACVPGPFPSFMTMDLESRLNADSAFGALDLSGADDALREYRSGSQLELNEMLAACAAWQRREPESSPEARRAIARAMDQLITFELTAIDRFAATMDPARAAAFRASEIGRLLVPGKSILNANASVVAVALGPNGKGVREVDELIAALNKAQQRMLAAHRAAWTAYFQTRVQGENTPYSAQMQEARRIVDAAIGAIFASLGSQELAGEQRSARVRLLAELSDRLKGLGKLDETGAWQPTPIDPSWPGDIVRSR
jgi:hypothetical protein